MKLWLIKHDGWGIEIAVVRAPSAEDALRVAREQGFYFGSDITELSAEGDAALLWSYDYSPDSRPGL